MARAEQGGGRSGEILLNGRPRPLTTDGLAELLAEIGHDPEAAGLAVAINDTVVPRREWSTRRLRPGDRVEIVGAVQGG